MTSFTEQKELFIKMMHVYCEISQNILFLDTPVSGVKKPENVFYAYFYPHPVLFLLYEEGEDIEEIYTFFTSKGYTVYPRTRVDHTIIEEAVLTNPVRYFVHNGPHPFINEAGERDLIVRDGTYRDVVKRWTWTCDGVVYTYNKPNPEEWYGLSAIKQDSSHLSTLYLSSIFGFDYKTCFPRNDSYTQHLQTLKKMPIESGNVLLIVKDKEGNMKKYPACKVTLKECKGYFRSLTGKRTFSTEYIRDLMQVIGFHGFTNVGKKPLNPSSLSVQRFFAPNPESGLAGDVLRVEGVVGIESAKNSSKIKSKSDGKSVTSTTNKDVVKTDSTNDLVSSHE